MQIEMKTIYLSKLFPEVASDVEGRRRTFALLNLGIVESLTEGTLTPGDAIRYFFNGENCLFVQEKLRDKTADEIMGRGVQLQDLFDILPKRAARQAFQRELQTIRALCSRLLQAKSTRRMARHAAAKR